MINKKLIILITTIISISLYSCQTAKDALVGKKRSDQSDEFLVEKKKPLIVPPDFDQLPVPGKLEASSKKETNSSDVKQLLKIDNDKQNSDTNLNQNTDIESSILKKIQ